MTGVDGVIRSRYDYTAFGEEYAPTSFEEMPQRYGYTGRERSSASESLNYRYRHYDPASGRFNQRDPAGLLGGNNLYR